MFSNCSQSTGNKDKKAFETNQALWKSLNIQNYQVTQSMTCYCRAELVSPNVVIVRNGQIESVNGEKIYDNVTPFKTIDAFFDYVKSTTGQNPAHAHVAYNTTYGFPTSMYFDMDERMADEEIGYKISDFKLLD